MELDLTVVSAFTGRVGGDTGPFAPFSTQNFQHCLLGSCGASFDILEIISAVKEGIVLRKGRRDLVGGDDA